MNFNNLFPMKLVDYFTQPIPIHATSLKNSSCYMFCPCYLRIVKNASSGS